MPRTIMQKKKERNIGHMHNSIKPDGKGPLSIMDEIIKIFISYLGQL
jgi:hypothetical protein